MVRLLTSLQVQKVIRKKESKGTAWRRELPLRLIVLQSRGSTRPLLAAPGGAVQCSAAVGLLLRPSERCMNHAPYEDDEEEEEEVLEVLFPGSSPPPTQENPARIISCVCVCVCVSTQIIDSILYSRMYSLVGYSMQHLLIIYLLVG